MEGKQDSHTPIGVLQTRTPVILDGFAESPQAPMVDNIEGLLRETVSSETGQVYGQRFQ